MLRSLQAELLDALPADHPDARRSRRDLRVLNALMGNSRWFARALPPRLRPGEAALELGAGDGTLARALAGKIVRLDAVDLAPRPPGWPAGWSWHQTDLRDFSGLADYPVVLANLVLHHFDEPALAALGRRLQSSARVLLVSEPLRRPAFLPLFRLTAALAGMNRVTRHDGRISIRAGFTGDELPRFLGLDPARWTWQLRATPFGACRMIAQRR